MLSFKNIHWWHWRAVYISLVWFVKSGLVWWHFWESGSDKSNRLKQAFKKIFPAVLRNLCRRGHFQLSVVPEDDCSVAV